MAVTIEDIQKKQFTIRPRGWDKFEVDAFLEDIMMQMDADHRELDELRQKCSALYETINTYKQTEDSLKELLMLAMNRKEQIISEANEKAAQIINDAQVKADEMTKDLDGKLDELRNEAEAMKAEYMNFKQKFEELIVEQLQYFKSSTGETDKDINI